MSRALVALAERGVRAEAEPNEAGKDLIRAIFGKDAIAENSIR
jgi:hypothetical protein